MTMCRVDRCNPTAASSAELTSVCILLRRVGEATAAEVDDELPKSLDEESCSLKVLMLDVKLKMLPLKFCLIFTKLFQSK